MTEAFAPAFCDELDRLLAWRRDVRHFTTEPLPPGLVDTLLDCAAQAPSVGNAPPWRFVRVATPALRSAVTANANAANARAATAYTDDRERAAYCALKLHGLREAPEHIAVFCDVPPGWSLVAYLCLGYPVAADRVPELERHGWQARLDRSCTRFVR